MYNPFNFLKQAITPSFLGVDIGTTSIKIVEVGQGKQLPKVINYALLENQSSLIRSSAVFQSSALKLFDREIIELLKAATERMKPKTKEVIASLPGFAAFTTVLNFPEMDSSELGKAMIFQAKQYIPLSLSEVALDWLKIGEYEDENGFKYSKVFLISVPKEQIKKYQRIFSGAGLRLRALEIEGLSLARSLTGNDPIPTMIVDIGSRSTAIAIIEQGQLKFTTQTDFAGTSLSQALASSLGINPLRAEELKKERGVIGTGPNYELSTIMLPLLDVIINEMKRAQFNYESQPGTAAKIERIILAGGGANLLGIEKYFTRQYGLPTVKAAPFNRFEYPTAVEPLVSELNPMLSVALGLALREFT